MSPRWVSGALLAVIVAVFVLAGFPVGYTGAGLVFALVVFATVYIGGDRIDARAGWFGVALGILANVATVAVDVLLLT